MSRKTLLFLILTAVIFRLLLLGVFGDIPSFTHEGDSYGYLTLADNIADQGVFSLQESPPYSPDAFRTPGYPGFLWLIKAAFGAYWPALLIQILLVAGIAVLMFEIAALTGLSTWMSAATTLFLFMPFSVLVSSRYLTQTLFTFLLMGAVYLWMRFFKSGSVPYFLVVAALVPLMAFVRPIGIWLYLPFLAALIFAGYKQNWRIGKMVMLICIFLTINFLVLSPWLVRNHKNFGEFSLSSIRPFQFYYYDLPGAVALHLDISIDSAAELLSKTAQPLLHPRDSYDLLEFPAGHILSQLSMNYVKEIPLAIVASRFKYLSSFFFRDGIHYWFQLGGGENYNKTVSLSQNVLYTLCVVFERLLLLLLFGGFLYCLCLLILGKMALTPEILLLILLVGYFSLLSGGTSSAGLRYPIEPFYFLLSIEGLRRFWMGLKFKHA